MCSLISNLNVNAYISENLPNSTDVSSISLSNPMKMTHKMFYPEGYSAEVLNDQMSSPVFLKAEHWLPKVFIWEES